MSRLIGSSLALLTLLSGGCTIGQQGGDPSSAPGFGEYQELPPFVSLAPGEVIYLLDDHIFATAIDASYKTDLSNELDAFSEGDDESPSVSRDGTWLTMTTGRFGCSGYPCLTVVRRDFAYARPVFAGGEKVFTVGRAAINDAGDWIVFAAELEGEGEGEGAGVGLFSISRTSEEAWSKPVLLTGSSPFSYNKEPVLHPDSSRLLFSCGNSPHSQDDGNGVCEIDSDGTGLRLAVDPSDNPLDPTPGDHFVHRGDYAPDNSIIFESDWDGERIWRQTPGGALSVVGDFNNDNSPCAFADGSIASLWLNRPGGQSLHEIKVMSSTGTDERVLTPNENVSDCCLRCAGRRN